MRNLVEYPVTREEVLQHLDQITHLVSKWQGVGGMHAMVVGAVREELAENVAALESVVERLEV